MPNSKNIGAAKALGNICLSDSEGHGAIFQTSEYIKAMAAIHENLFHRKQRFFQYLNRYEEEATTASHLKKMMGFQRQHAPNKTMRTCNTIPISCIRKDAEIIPVTMRVNEYAFSMSGLNRCKNPYCNLCSRSRAGERAHKIRRGIEVASDNGFDVFFVSLTIPRQQDIKTAREEISRRWKALSNVFQQMEQTVYYTRALDVTFNKYVKSQRYHLHVHAVVIVENAPKTFAQTIQTTWTAQNTATCRALAKLQDVERVTLTHDSIGKVSKYVAKMAGLALEISNGTMKSTTKSKWTDTLQDLMIDDTPITRAIYKEYLEGMRRARTLQTSKNWNDLLKLAEDEEENELEQFEIDIPLHRWLSVKPHWLDIAEKVQFEIFQNSYTAAGELDYIRIDKILNDVQTIINNAVDDVEISLIPYLTYD